MKPRVVIFRSTPIAPEPRVEKIAAVLAGSYQVYIVGWDRTGKLPIKQETGSFSLERYSHPAAFGSGMRNLGRLLQWQLFLIGWVIRNGKGIRIIHACDFDTVLPALLAKLIFCCRVVYDIFDFYADHVRNTPWWIKSLIRQADRAAVRLSDAVILVDESRRVQLKGIRISQLEVIYNTPLDVPTAKAFPVDAPTQALGLTLPPEQEQAQPISLRLAYVGLLQVERGLLIVLEVLQKHPNWHLDLAGFGGDESLILEHLAQSTNVTWHGQVPYEIALALNLAADVLFATYDPSIENHRYASPNKVFEAMMLGKPVVVARDTNMDRLIEANRCGLVVPFGESGALEAAFERLALDVQLRGELGRNARLAYDSRYSWDKMGEKLLQLYASLIRAPKNL